MRSRHQESKRNREARLDLHHLLDGLLCCIESLCYVLDLIIVLIAYCVYLIYNGSGSLRGPLKKLANVLVLTELELIEALLNTTMAQIATMGIKVRVLPQREATVLLREYLSTRNYLEGPFIRMLELHSTIHHRRCRKQVFTIWMFHGTRYKNILSIAAQGLKRPHSQSSIWVTNSLYHALDYTDTTRSGRRFVCLVEVRLTLSELEEQDQFAVNRRVHVQSGSFHRREELLILSVEDASRIQTRYLLMVDDNSL